MQPTITVSTFAAAQYSVIWQLPVLYSQNIVKLTLQVDDLIAEVFKLWEK